VRTRFLNTENSSDERLPFAGIDVAVSQRIFAALLVIVVGGFVAFRVLSKPMGPPPPEVAKDPLLLQGREIYFARCVACHGNDGRGDGPLAANLIGPPVGNLTDNEWKHGDRPDQVMGVIAKGVPNTRMDGWDRVLDPPEIKAAAAYVYYLAKRPAPEELRKP
jgi:cytochrome c oxidase cbb3-type subunit III